MSPLIHRLLMTGLVAAFVSSTAYSQVPKVTTAEPIMAITADSVVIYGETYFGDLEATTPLILLFHQGGSNGRGEYADLAGWLNEIGFRAIAWDQRAGGDTYGETNRTATLLTEGTPAGFCDTYADLQAALDFVTTQGISEHVIVWGSSYSASLVFRLAAEYPSKVAGLLAFSPASGGPMAGCRARMWVDDVTVPMLVLRPASEMSRESSIEQREILTAAGAEFWVVENGIHGSSMLVDTRTGHDMRDTRTMIEQWLNSVTHHKE